jgi:hypothetical protein
MTSCTEDMPRSAWRVALETDHGASPIIRRILDWLLWLIDVSDLLAQPHNSIYIIYYTYIKQETFISSTSATHH